MILAADPTAPAAGEAHHAVGPDGGDPRRFSFADLARSSDRAARFLAGQGGHVAVRVKPERPVGMFTGYWRDPEATAAAFRIGPFEVESALVEHPAAVVGRPDPQRGQIVKAFVVLAPGHEGSDALAAELQEHCRTVTAAYKYPRKIEFTVELPKTISGKIRRVELRERVQAPGA